MKETKVSDYEEGEMRHDDYEAPPTEMKTETKREWMSSPEDGEDREDEKGNEIDENPEEDVAPAF